MRKLEGEEEGLRKKWKREQFLGKFLYENFMVKGGRWGGRGFSISFWKVCPSQAEFIGFPGGYMEAFKV